MGKFHFGENLQRIRRASGISQEAMALNLGISQSRYSRIERDLSMPEPDMVPKIAKLLNVDVTALGPQVVELGQDELATISGFGSGGQRRERRVRQWPYTIVIVLIAIVVLPNWAGEIAVSFCEGLGTTEHVAMGAKWAASLVMFIWIVYWARKIWKQR